MTVIPRGVRNNNPCNIDYHPANQWLGQLGIETGVGKPRFARFDCPENGIRAGAKLIIGYVNKGFNSVRKIINRWAPPTENDTESYIQSVAKSVGIDADAPLTISAYMLVVVLNAIIKHEQGYAPYSIDVIRDGVLRALK